MKNVAFRIHLLKEDKTDNRGSVYSRGIELFSFTNSNAVAWFNSSLKYLFINEHGITLSKLIRQWYAFVEKCLVCSTIAEKVWPVIMRYECVPIVIRFSRRINNRLIRHDDDATFRV